MKSIHIFTLFVHAYFPNCRICLFSFFPWSTIGAFLCPFLFRGAVALFPSPLAPLSIFLHSTQPGAAERDLRRFSARTLSAPPPPSLSPPPAVTEDGAKLDRNFQTLSEENEGGRLPLPYTVLLFSFISSILPLLHQGLFISLSRATFLIKKVPPPLQPFVHPRGRREEGHGVCVCPAHLAFHRPPFHPRHLILFFFLPSFLRLRLERLVGVGKEEESVAKKKE